MKSSILLLGVAVTGVLAAPKPHDYEVHERRDVLPSSWTEGKRLDGSTTLPMRIGLTQSNLDYGHDLLMDMSNPSSSQYGKHMSAEEVHDLFAPSDETVAGVRAWLESSGIDADRISQSMNKQWIQFDADADEVERLLHTEYYIYDHSVTGRSHVACREYHVPRSVREHVDYIMPGIALREVTNVGKKRDAEKRSAEGALSKRGTFPNPISPILSPITFPLEMLLSDLIPMCGVAVTPECIKQMYRIPPGNSSTKGNKMGIFEGISDVYAQEDFDLFFSTLAMNIPTGTHPEHRLINGAVAPYPVHRAGPESDLDFQISYPIIWPQNSVLYQTDSVHYQNHYTFRGFLNTFLDAIDGSYCDFVSPLDPHYPDPHPNGYNKTRMCGVYEPTNVISISYGQAEADLPISYHRRQCAEWMKLGMQGVSVVVASGDSGVQGRYGDPTPSNCLGGGDVFAPIFPASCPYMTAAGSTYLPPGTDVNSHQQSATTSFYSGGGFSNIYARQDWQAEAIKEYFAKNDPGYPYYESVNNNSFGENGGIYNRMGRGYPDVSAIGDKIIIFNRGAPVSIGGTSAAAPVWGAILTRINEERLAAGKPPVGFVNPVLYAHPEVFYDVTEGSNPGCGTNGFTAAKGWDPVTGMGGPNYPALLDLFMSL